MLPIFTIGIHYGGVGMGKVLEIVNKKFGKLTVISRENNDKHGFSQWLCLCECGKFSVASGTSLKSGHTSSCGCYQKEKLSQIMTTHGHAKSQIGRAHV